MGLRISLVAVAIASLFVAQAHAQTLYRYVDAQGKVHYSDTPPPTSAKEARTVTTDAAADQKAADNLREQNEAVVKRSAERNKTPAEREREKKEEDRRARCSQMSGVVSALERGEPVFRQDDKGGKVELKGQDREFEKLRSGQQYQMECSDIARDSASAAAKSRASNPPPAGSAGNAAPGAGGAGNAGGGGSAAPRGNAGTAGSPAPSSTGSASGK
jgi:hypothetical protein